MATKLLIIIPSWISLGIYRGIKCYNYEYKKECKKYGKKLQYHYTDCLFMGFVGGIVYINPLGMFLIITKELYRLEVNIRGLDEEKETDQYNRLF